MLLYQRKLLISYFIGIIPSVLLVGATGGCSKGDLQVIALDRQMIEREIESGNRIKRAIEKYKKSTGQLPESLELNLVPEYLPKIPNGENGREWMYDQNEEGFRLSLSMQHFTNSFDALVYDSQGKAADLVRNQTEIRTLTFDDWVYLIGAQRVIRASGKANGAGEDSRGGTDK